MKRKIAKRLRLYEFTMIAIFAVGLTYVIGMHLFINGADQSGTKRLVTFYDRGVQRVVLTRADTVQGAIDDSNMEINPQDVLEPSRDDKLTSQNQDVIVYRSRLVAVNDGGIRERVVTVAQSANAILSDARLQPLGPDDKTRFAKGSLERDGTPIVLEITRVEPEPEQVKPRPIVFAPLPNALTRSKGAQIFVDSLGVAHRETYYDLPMNVVIGACGGGSYSIRSDGAKIDQDGYVLVAANLNSYPRCTIVETSLGPGKVYDTGGFAVRHPYGFDLATDWTNYNGQ